MTRNWSVACLRSASFASRRIDTNFTPSLLQEWEVYVDQSKASLERGASATLDAFVVLSPPEVLVVPAKFRSKSKSKGPLIRCIAIDDETECMEISNVDSVDKVYRTLTRHMRVQVRCLGFAPLSESLCCHSPIADETGSRGCCERMPQVEVCRKWASRGI